MDGISQADAHSPVGSDPAGAPGDVRGDVNADENAAADARRRYQSEPMPSLGPDAVIAPHLAPDERVLAVRGGVGFERGSDGGAEATRGRAVLYLTSARLIVFSEPMISIDLEDVLEVLLAPGRLLLVLRGGAGVALETEQPQLLRVEIAAARAVART